jgi:putative transport protein
MDFVVASLEQQPLVALFLTIAVGYLLGEVSIGGLSLGVGMVLFVALGMGWLAPKAAPPAMLGNFGLALFLYAVGIQYGKQFFLGITSASGLKDNLVALLAVMTSGAVALSFVKLLNLKAAYALGLFAGSATSTPALQAAIAALGNDDPAVGYSVAYPFGVAGPILFLFLAFALSRPKIEAPTGADMELRELALERPEYFGKHLTELMAVLPPEVRIVALRRDQQNQPASPELVLRENDVLLAVAPSRAILDRLEKTLGEAVPGSVTADRRHLDYLRVFASRASVVGGTLGELALPGDTASIVVQVRRGDMDLLPETELVLEYGDRVGILAHRADFAALRAYFGDSIKAAGEFSYISIGLGMALGFLVGAVKIPLPGIGRISLGLSGVLIVAMVLGARRRSAGLSWVIPLPAAIVLRNLGLTVFLAQVGMASGPKFAATVLDTGLLMLCLGALVLAAMVLPILLLGLLVFRMPFDRVMGIIAGACGNPAILAYINRLVPNEKPDLGYAMIFPGMTVVKILFVSIVPALM